MNSNQIYIINMIYNKIEPKYKGDIDDFKHK